MMFNFSSNIKKIPFEKYEKDFVFIVNGKRYETSRFEADLISPIIRNYHYNDEAISEFSIDLKISKEEENDYFLDFLNYFKKDNQVIDSIHQNYYINYFFQLGNADENSFFKIDLIDELAPDNIIARLKTASEIIKNIKKFTSKDFNQSNLFLDGLNFNKMIQYASSNFDQISKKDMETLDDYIIEEIISNDSLKIDSEDSLFQFIIDLYEKDQTKSYLFEYIYFNNISQISFEKFIEKFSIENLNSRIWYSICERLLPTTKTESTNNRYMLDKYIIKFKHKRGEEFNGIMNFLNKKEGGNIHDLGIIEITSNSIYSTCIPKNLIDYQSENFYYSLDDPKACVCFDFKDKKLQISSYSLKSSNFGPNDYHLKNWVLEVSNDQKNWEIIDEHNDDPVLNGQGIIVTFKTKTQNSFYQFIRLRQTRTNWYGDYQIRLSKIEFYGKLKEPFLTK